MQRTTEVKVLEGYRLDVRFDDEVEGEIDLSDRLFGTVFEPLKDPPLFA